MPSLNMYSKQVLFNTNLVYKQNNSHGLGQVNTVNYPTQGLCTS